MQVFITKNHIKKVVSNYKGWPCSDNNRYFEQYNAILNSDAKSLLQFKKQWKETNGHN
jgi:hypothetical protein